MSKGIRTVFLDRDGVINQKAPNGEYIERWDQFTFLPGAVEAILKLRRAGFRIIVVTNQRGIALKRMTRAAVDDIHRRMSGPLSGSDDEPPTVLVCPHDIRSCACRKPDLGLFRQAEARFPDLDALSSIVIGDTEADITFGNRLGCTTYLVGDPKLATRILEDAPGTRIDGLASTLLEVVDLFILSSTGSALVADPKQGLSRP